MLLMHLAYASLHILYSIALCISEISPSCHTHCIKQRSVESVSSTRSDGSSLNSSGQAVDHSFSHRFTIPTGEQPLPVWETGKRCSIMDRDKPLSLTRSGRLYMTQK